MKLPLSVLVLLPMAMASFGADIDGRWAGSVLSPDGEHPVEFEFKADGPVLTGTFTDVAPEAQTTFKIADGKINGNNITFSVVVVDRGGNALTMNFKGVQDKDQIKLTMGTSGGIPMEFVVKRRA
jgi:hypothetical protein